MRKAIPILIVSVAIAGWHFYVCMSMENECYNINPLTDVTTLKMPGAERLVPGAERLAFTGGRDLYIHDTVVVLPAAERKLRVIQVRSCLNHYARRYLDLYAMIVPYRVNAIDK
jgi:hypothetical protein